MADRIDTGFEMEAVKFQRLMQGVVLLTALFFKSMLLVYFMILIMVAGIIFTAKHAPFALVYKRLVKSDETSKTIEGGLDLSAERFACSLGTSFLLLAAALNYYNYEGLAWVVVGVVTALSLLAGTVGFCLGSAIYYEIKGKLTW